MQVEASEDAIKYALLICRDTSLKMCVKKEKMNLK